MPRRTDSTVTRTQQVQPGVRFGRLTVRALAPRVKKKGPRCWICDCTCGNTTVVPGGNLAYGFTKSCGCLRLQLAREQGTHHKVGTPTYSTWSAIIARCTNPRHEKWNDYGGRGVTVCEKWRHDFAAFLADMGEKPSLDHSIERIDNGGNYEPGNCRWATAKEQARNKRNNRLITFRGETRCFAEWAEVLGINRGTLRHRIDRAGWSVERAFTTPCGSSQT